jgi:hypothetical protein
MVPFVSGTGDGEQGDNAATATISVDHH